MVQINQLAGSSSRFQLYWCGSGCVWSVFVSSLYVWAMTVAGGGKAAGGGKTAGIGKGARGLAYSRALYIAGKV